jgi:hypothetical protein
VTLAIQVDHPLTEDRLRAALGVLILVPPWWRSREERSQHDARHAGWPVYAASH